MRLNNNQSFSSIDIPLFNTANHRSHSYSFSHRFCTFPSVRFVFLSLSLCRELRLDECKQDIDFSFLYSFIPMRSRNKRQTINEIFFETTDVCVRSFFLIQVYTYLMEISMHARPTTINTTHHYCQSDARVERIDQILAEKTKSKISTLCGGFHNTHKNRTASGRRRVIGRNNEKNAFAECCSVFHSSEGKSIREEISFSPDWETQKQLFFVYTTMNT